MMMMSLELDDSSFTRTEHSILCLVKRLIKSNYTLCFAGDSIDLQLYESIFRQLQRLEGLQQKYFNASLSFHFRTREIPVKYNQPCGLLHAGFRPCGYGYKSMKQLKETIVESRSESAGVGLIRYIKFYGWSPWVSVLCFVITASS